MAKKKTATTKASTKATTTKAATTKAAATTKTTTEATTTKASTTQAEPESAAVASWVPTVSLEEARLAVLAAHAAIGSGDREAIADARIGLEGAELTHLDLHERLAEAELPLAADKVEPLRERWAEAIAVVAKKRPLKLPFDAAELPALEPRRPLELVFDGALLLQALKRELAKKEQLGVVKLLREAATRESRDTFALALAEAWRQAGQTSSEAWAWVQMGELGGDRCAELVGSLLEELTHARAVDGLQILGQIGTHQAFCDIYRLGWLPARYPPRSERARGIFTAYAQRRKESTPQAAARLVPAWPAEAARERAEATTRHRFVGALRDGDRIDARTFDCYVRRHPLVADLARGLVWGRYASNARTTELRQSFRIDEALVLRDVDDAPIDLPAHGWFGVAHPLELEQLAPQLKLRWQGRLAAAKVEPTFDQLGRPLPTLDAAQLGAKELTHFAGRRVGFHRIREVLRARGWFDGEENDGGGTDAFGLRLQRSGGFAQAILGPGEISRLEVGKGRSYYSFSVRQPISWMHPIDRAEVLADIEAAVGPAPAARPARSSRAAERSAAASRPSSASTASSGAAAAAEAGPDVLPQRGRYPFAELAKSSRSKCVVCGEKIDKGTVRIGIERVFETPNFTGRGSAYLHPGCEAGCPELRSIDDLDARLAETSPETWPPR